MASTMQLEFSQAMLDFKTMFPDMDRDVIEAVLRANQGAVDATIDQLLQMSTDNQNEKLRNELDAVISPQHSLIDLNDNDTKLSSLQPTTTTKLIDISISEMEVINDGQPSVAVDSTGTLMNLTNEGNPTTLAAFQATATPPTNGGVVNSCSTGASTKISALNHQQTNKSHETKLPKFCNVNDSAINFGVNRKTKWNPPLLSPLPVGFLRFTSCPINNVPSTINLPYDSSRGEFDLPDEQFAMMLQNEEFMNHLRWNQEFMNALDKEHCGGKTKCSEDDAIFKERLKHMGKVSRKKFLQIARVFTWQRNKKVTMAKQIDALPLKEEPSDDEDHKHEYQRQPQQSASQELQYVIQDSQQAGTNSLEQATENPPQKFCFK